MKKAVKHAAKKSTTAGMKSAKAPRTKHAGYKEEAYNHEKQKAYQKSDAAKDNTENTAGPKD